MRNPAVPISRNGGVTFFVDVGERYMCAAVVRGGTLFLTFNWAATLLVNRFAGKDYKSHIIAK